MDNYINDALDIIELNESSERTKLCRRHEATLPNYTRRLALKLAKGITKKGRYTKGVCSDRLVFCFGDRLSHYTVDTTDVGSCYITVDWALFIRDHKLHAPANQLLTLALSRLFPDHHVVAHGETPKHAFAFLLKGKTP